MEDSVHRKYSYYTSRNRHLLPDIWGRSHKYHGTYSWGGWKSPYLNGIGSHQQPLLLIRHTDLDIIRREQLVISHIVLFDSHESSGMISLGIAIASISTDLYLFYIFIQLWQIFLKFFIMALLDWLSMSFTGDKRCFIQLPDFCVFRCGFL